MQLFCDRCISEIVLYNILKMNVRFGRAPFWQQKPIYYLSRICSSAQSSTAPCALLRANNNKHITRIAQVTQVDILKPSLLWRHNGRGSVPNHQPHDCLLNRLVRRRSKKTSKLRVTGFCAGNSPMTGEFPAKMASNAENVSIWWRHHVNERMVAQKTKGRGTKYPDSSGCRYRCPFSSRMWKSKYAFKHIHAWPK